MEIGSEDESERPTSSRHIGLLNHAKAFAEAANIIVKAHAPYERINKAPLPLYYLCGHAIELALKSVLRLHGDSDVSLKKISHNLVSALNKATSHPQKHCFSAELNQAVKMLNSYYSRKALEYYDKPKLMTLPDARKLLEIVNALIENLDKEYRALWRARQIPGVGSGR